MFRYASNQSLEWLTVAGGVATGLTDADNYNIVAPNAL